MSTIQSPLKTELRSTTQAEFCLAVMQTLTAFGITHLCFSSGFRNSLLVVAASRTDGLQVISHFDERGLGFFALGLAKAGKKVAVLTTSGTAAINLFPAIAESKQSYTPMIVITADRPETLHNTGANQTLKQKGLFGNFVNLELQLGLPENTQQECSRLFQALFSSQFVIPGPVHINVALKEPFDFKATKTVEIDLPKIRLSDRPELDLSDLNFENEGLIVAGEMSENSSQQLLALSQKLKWPIAACVLSHLRNINDDSICSIQDFIHNPLIPKNIIVIGRGFSDSQMERYFDTYQGRLIHLQPYVLKEDVQRPSTEIRVGRLTETTIETVKEKDEGNWVAQWNAHRRKETIGVNKEADIAKLVSESISEQQFLFLGNSLSIRNYNRYAAQSCDRGFPCFANRGVSGIDGLLATATGLAEGLQRAGVICLGDLSFLHDLNSLQLIKKSKFNVKVIVINNDGGGIFKNLPGVDDVDDFETCFQTPHGLRFQAAATLFSLPFLQIEDLDSLKRWLKTDGSGIAEIVI